MDHQSLSALAVFVPQSHCLLASFLLFFFLLYIWGCLLIEVAYLLCVWNNGILLRQCGVCICEPAGQGSASCEQNRMKQPPKHCSALGPHSSFGAVHFTKISSSLFIYCRGGAVEHKRKRKKQKNTRCIKHRNLKVSFSFLQNGVCYFKILRRVPLCGVALLIIALLLLLIVALLIRALLVISLLVVSLLVVSLGIALVIV